MRAVLTLRRMGRADLTFSMDCTPGAEVATNIVANMEESYASASREPSLTCAHHFETYRYLPVSSARIADSNLRSLVLGSSSMLLLQMK